MKRIIPIIPNGVDCSECEAPSKCEGCPKQEDNDESSEEDGE